MSSYYGCGSRSSLPITAMNSFSLTVQLLNLRGTERLMVLDGPIYAVILFVCLASIMLGRYHSWASSEVWNHETVVDICVTFLISGWFLAFSSGLHGCELVAATCQRSRGPESGGFAGHGPSRTQASHRILTPEALPYLPVATAMLQIACSAPVVSTGSVWLVTSFMGFEIAVLGAASCYLKLGLKDLSPKIHINYAVNYFLIYI